ncbi:sensor histidine kinase [Actinomadura luteofluorescens]|uniref:sensor histidine kinase n=1 Tax=Actinomadura luteofluorescens TaxID=46163 RepID=UPI00216435B5|nr:nitrate- and nitrite sensing domain-containing protein [Actinomadura glauciflava]
MKSPRRRSIRSKVTALLLVPLLSLVALWGYAAIITGRDALAQRRYHTLDREFAPSGQGVLVELGKERLASAVFLSTPRQAAGGIPAALVSQRSRLDDAVENFRRKAASDAARSATNAEMESRVSAVLRALGGLGGLRAAVDARSVDRLAAVNGYGTMVDNMHRLYDSLVAIDDSALYDWTQSTRHAGRGMELLQRENALVAGAFITKGRMTAAEHRMFVEMVGEQRWQWTKQRSLLDPVVYRTGTAQVFASPRYQTFKAMEDRIADADPRRPIPVQPGEWQRTAQPLVLSVNEMVLGNSRRAGEHADDLGREAYLRLAAVGGLGLLAILLSVLLSLRFARGFVRELVGLRGSAEELAEQRLPGIVERLGRNESVDVAAEAPPLDAGRTAEVARLAEAFARVQRTAVDAAVGQAELRAGVSRIFLNIARRNQSLLHRQLTLLDGLESRAEADDLEDLFRIDHLTTRMRRHAESLIILSGATPGRGWRRPVRFADVLRAAVSEIEDYTRATVLTDSEDGLVGAAVTDVVHLLAELIENAAAFSPPNTEVRVMAERVGTGYAVEVEDRGLGVKPEQLAEANRRLAEPPEYDLVDTDQLGLFVVARLAARHDITVTLHRSPYGGVTAIVLFPHELVVSAEEMAAGVLPPAHGPEDAPAALTGTAVDGGPEREAMLMAAPVPEGVVPLRDPAELARPADDPRHGQRNAPGHLDGAGGHLEAPPALPALTGPQAPAADPAPAAPWGVPDRPMPPAPPRPAPNPWSDDAHTPEAGGPGGAADENTDEAAGEDWQPAGTHAGLPRRVRQRNLAPQLRKNPPSPPPPGGTANGAVARSPEEARSLMASIQQGWRRGRASDMGDEGTR